MRRALGLLLWLVIVPGFGCAGGGTNLLGTLGDVRAPYHDQQRLNFFHDREFARLATRYRLVRLDGVTAAQSELIESETPPPPLAAKADLMRTMHDVQRLETARPIAERESLAAMGAPAIWSELDHRARAALLEDIGVLALR